MANLMPTPIVALDFPDIAAALNIVNRLGDSCHYYKVGSELFTASGTVALETLGNAGKRVFLDLKFHDIPTTVRGAARSAARAGASLITVHALGGGAMMEAAVEGAGSACEVLGVTILTSMDRAALEDVLGRPVEAVSEEANRLAALAKASGARGVVCSGQEAERIRREHNLATLVPGVRLPGDSAHDQSRVVTPRDAALAGATWVVLGRTVTAAADPVEAMRRVSQDLASVAAR